jgi:hypothetical protein
MRAIISKLLVGAAALAIACAPLAASAQQNDWHHNGGNMQRPGPVHRDVHYGYGRPGFHRYNEGYYGNAPGGFRGYYHNGRWFHHRRQQAGIFLYF